MQFTTPIGSAESVFKLRASKSENTKKYQRKIQKKK